MKIKIAKTKPTKRTKKVVKPIPITVEVMGHDSWSGTELAYTKDFPTRAKAETFIQSIHAENTAPSAPEYYNTAHIKGEGSPWFR